MAITGAKPSNINIRKTEALFRMEYSKRPGMEGRYYHILPPSKDLDEQNEGNENERGLHYVLHAWRIGFICSNIINKASQYIP
jgi:hypothetical protein